MARASIVYYCPKNMGPLRLEVNTVITEEPDESWNK